MKEIASEFRLFYDNNSPGAEYGLKDVPSPWEQFMIENKKRWRIANWVGCLLSTVMAVCTFQIISLYPDNPDEGD